MGPTLKIRYANPDTIPGAYARRAGWVRTDPIISNGYWTLYGPDDTLRRHVELALADNNVNDYRIYRGV